MSICPNKDLYSVYIDGELPSPWKEKLEAHLKDCSECRTVLNSYEELSRKIAATKPPNLNMNESFLRLCEKRKNTLNTGNFKNKKENWLYKTVKIPIPALAAAALFLFVFTPVLFMTIKKTTENESVVISNFKPIVPILNTDAEASKKINFTNLHTLGIRNIEVLTETKKHKINLNNFINLYLPAEKANGKNVIIQIPDFGSNFIENTEPFDATFVKNEQ